MTAAALYLVLYGERCGVAWPTSSWQKLFGGRGQKNLLSRDSATAFKRFIGEQSEWSNYFFIENGYTTDDGRTLATRIFPKPEASRILLANFVDYLGQQIIREPHGDSQKVARGLADVGEVVVKAKARKRSKGSKVKLDIDEVLTRRMKQSLKEINDGIGRTKFTIDQGQLEAARNAMIKEKRFKAKEIRRQLLQRYPDKDLPEAYGDVHERIATEGECYQQASYIPGWRQYEVAREGRRQEANKIISGARKRYTDYELQPLAPKTIALSSDIFQYKRSFTNDLSCGGRFYSRFQNFPKYYRQALLMDGEPVVELDYSCIHPAMLYHREGLRVEDDIYAKLGAGPEFRSAVKVAINTAINAKSPHQTAESIRSRAFPVNGLKYDDVFILPEAFGDDYMAFVDTLAEVYQPIAKHLNSGAGLWLQRLDSDIAEHIMLTMHKQRVPCITIHDSAIVPRRFESELRKVMIAAYQMVVGTEFEPRIK